MWKNYAREECFPGAKALLCTTALVGYLGTMRRHLLFIVVLLSSFTSWGAAGNFKVTTDRSVDASSLETIVQSVIARSGAKTNDEKAVAIYEWLHQAIFHGAYATEPEPQSVGPLKLLHVYGWGLCGGEHTVLKALFETVGWECRYVGWSDPGHTTIEVKYDGRWHYLDVFLKCYFWSKDRSHIASQEEIAADASIVLDAVKDGRAAREHLCCGDSAEGVVSGVKSRKVAGDSKGWASVTWRDEGWAPALRLPCGAALRLEWKAADQGFAVSGKAPQHSCGTKDFRDNPVLGPLLEHYGPRNWSNGRLVYAPDFSQPADMADIELANAKAAGGKLVANGSGTAIFRLPLPYAYVGATVQTAFVGEGKLSLSTDGGKTWKPCGTSPVVKQKYDVCFKAEFTGALEKFRVEALVEHNRGVQPYLVLGKNRVIASSDAAQPDAVASVTFAWQEATAPKRKQWNGSGLSYGAELTATRDLSGSTASFDIEVAGNTAPKMLFVERAVRARR